MTTTVVTPEPVAEPVATAVPVTPVVAEPVVAAAPARPDGLPDTYWDDAVGVKPEAYSRLAELEAAEAARAAGVPATVADYKLEPTEPVLGLDGQPVAFDATDPLATSVLDVLHKHGVGQAVASDLLQAYAALEVEGAKVQAEFIKAEQAKLGAEHAKRTGAVHAAVAGKIGADKAADLMGVLGSADAFIALEALTSGITGPAISAVPAAKPNADLEGLHGQDLLVAARARKAG